MGLLSRVKNKAAGRARALAEKGRNRLNEKLGLPPRTKKDDPILNQGPTFDAAGERGRVGWDGVLPELVALGNKTQAQFQARLVDAELKLRDALDALEAEARAKADPPDGWHEQAERIAKAFQQTNEILIEAWARAFKHIEAGWTKAGDDVASLPWRRAWEHASAAFDQVFLGEWENLQGVLEDRCSALKDEFQRWSTMPLAPHLHPGAWQRANSSVDGGLRRANGDLWGVWGTAASLLRKCSRQVLEEVDLPAKVFPGAFSDINHHFDKAIDANAADLGGSWIAAVSILKEALDGSP